MRKNLLLLFIASTVMSSLANKIPSLVIHTNDNLTTKIALTDYPVVTIDGETLTVKSNTKQLNYIITQVNKFTYVDTESSILDVNNTENCIISDRSIKITPSSNSVEISITAANGRIEYYRNISIGSSVEIPLTKFQRGIHIITVNGVSSKLLLK